MAPKSSLKLAKDSFRSKDYESAKRHASSALQDDPSAVPAILILARAHELTQDVETAIKVYHQAVTIAPNQAEPWMGLKGIYKTRGKSGVDDYISACVRLAECKIEATKDEAELAEAVSQEIKDAIRFATSAGGRLQRARAMGLQVPTSPFYEYIADRSPQPLKTWLDIAALLESWEQSTINKLVGERRTRIGARLKEVTAQTKRECYSQSNLDQVYENIINWAYDDTLRRDYEEKQFLRAVDKLEISETAEKASLADEVLNLARGMVIVKHPYEVAWKINLEWRDGETLDEWDFDLLMEFVKLFPQSGLAKVIEGFLYSPLSPFGDIDDDEQDQKRQKERGVDLRDAEARLEYMTDGLNEAKDSIMAHRLMAQYFLYREEYELAIQTSNVGLQLTRSLETLSGVGYQETTNGFNCVIGTSLIELDPPKNHPQARGILQAIIRPTPSHFGALRGLGQISESEEQYTAALEFFRQALSTEPSSTQTKIDIAWCEAMLGSYEASLVKLKGYLEQLPNANKEDRKLRVQTTFRIGRCIWAMDPTRVGRKDRRGAYSWFLSAIKIEPSFAPAYTYLGVFYLDYAHDRRRGRQCFQKAFELSTQETVAAEYLARDFGDRKEWDVVELISNRVVDSGHALPPTGSKRKGLSWPFSALGVVNMNRADFHAAATKFLSALRVNPSDYDSYVGLAEAYHNSGRHNSALRTVLSAQDLIQQGASGESSWFATYILANIHRDIGQSDEAISAYKSVLKTRPGEFGVQIALLQTIVEQGFGNLASGMYGRAANGFVSAINLCLNIGTRSAFNLWKAIGDACTGLSILQPPRTDSNSSVIGVLRSLLETEFDTNEYDLFSDVDGVSWSALTDNIEGLPKMLAAGILAYKRAILVSNDSVPSQAVGWFNLGCAEYRAYRLSQRSDSPATVPASFLRASIRCFKRAIELESANADFWTALGIATSPLNVAVSQHSLVRALNINTRNAHAWTSLGSLYLQENDAELAQIAFLRAISTEPEFASAWIGSGMTEEIQGRGSEKAELEALANFEHALDIGTDADEVAKRKFAVASFKAMVGQGRTDVLRPLFALRQLSLLRPDDISLAHLRCLYLERAGDHDGALESLLSVCAHLEAEFERDERDEVLVYFCVAKADAARNLLAVRRFDEAREWAEEAVSLLLDSTTDPVIGNLVDRARLSGLLTQGLGAYYENDMSAALDAFRQALQASGSGSSKEGDRIGSNDTITSEIMCLLAQVLWAQAGADERVVAKESLEELVDGPDGWKPVTMVGLMAVIEDDVAAARAVISDLEAAQEKRSTTTTTTTATTTGAGGDEQVTSAAKLDRILALLRQFVRTADSAGNSQARSRRRSKAVDGSVLAAVMAHPFRPTPWAELATSIEEASSGAGADAGAGRPSGSGSGSGPPVFARQMAVLTADKLARPRTDISVDELGEHLAASPGMEDRLAAVMLAPWKPSGWIGLRECAMAR